MSTLNKYNGMKIGDLISAYHSGIHRLTKIEERKVYAPLFTYDRVYTSAGKKSSRKNLQCHCDCCQPAKEYLKYEVARMEAELKNLKAFRERLENED